MAFIIHFVQKITRAPFEVRPQLESVFRISDVFSAEPGLGELRTENFFSLRDAEVERKLDGADGLILDAAVAQPIYVHSYIVKVY